MPTEKLTWLDYLIISNPQGIMMVLNRYGYTGYLAPLDEDEMYEVCMDLIDKHGDSIIVELLKSHPLYDTIAQICTQESKVSVKFKNASGHVSEFVTKIKSIDYKKLIADLLIIIGAFYIAGRLWKYLAKE